MTDVRHAPHSTPTCGATLASHRPHFGLVSEWHVVKHSTLPPHPSPLCTLWGREGAAVASGLCQGQNNS